MIKKRKWDLPMDLQWLKSNEVVADPLGDLNITDGKLSVWCIEEDESNLDLIITALAANRQKFDKFEYGLFDQKLLDAVGISVKKDLGRTPLAEANDWHRDLIELTVDKASMLVNTIFNRLEKRRILDREIRAKILKAVESGDITLNKLDPSMQNKIKERRSA
jgi:hypothetical protein